MLAEVVFKTVSSLLLATDLVGNTLVILVILNRTRCMKTAMNYLLLNLAIADMMACSFIAPRLLCFL